MDLQSCDLRAIFMKAGVLSLPETATSPFLLTESLLR